MRVLIIDDILPHPSFGAGFPRMHQIVLAILSLGHKIDFFETMSLNYEDVMTHNPGFDYGELKHLICNNSTMKPTDAVIISRPHNMFDFKDEIRKAFPKAKLIYDMEALWYRRFELQEKITGVIPEWAERYNNYNEIEMAKYADACIVVNDDFFIDFVGVPFHSVNWALIKTGVGS